MTIASTSTTVSLRARVADVLSAADPTRSAGAHDLLCDIGRPGRLAEILRDLCRDDAVVAEVAQRSYRHVLGFDKIVLLDAADLGLLRLHVWWPRPSRRSEHVHSHRFHFASRIVCGHLASVLYQRGDDGADVIEFRETSLEHTHRWRFERIGPTTLRPTMRVELAEGSYYTMSADLLHRIDVPPTAFAASIFLQTPPLRTWSSVFTRPTDDPPQPLAQHGFDPAELRRRITRLVSMVS